MLRLRWGPWSELGEHRDVLREGYRSLLLEVLARARPVAGEHARNTLASLLLTGVPHWSLPGPIRWLFRSSPEIQTLIVSRVGSDEHTRAHESLVRLLWDGEASPDRFVDACLDVLLRDPEQRQPGNVDEDGPVVAAIDALCAMTVCFGGPSARSIFRRQLPRDGPQGREAVRVHARELSDVHGTRFAGLRAGALRCTDLPS